MSTAFGPKVIKIFQNANYKIGRTEYWSGFGNARIDLFGFADFVAIRSDIPGVTAIQVTSADNISHHINKYLKNEFVRVWLQAGNRFWIIGWYYVPGGRTRWFYEVCTVKLLDDELQFTRNALVEISPPPQTLGSVENTSVEVGSEVGGERTSAT